MTAKVTLERTPATLFAAVREDPVLWGKCQHVFKTRDFPERAMLLREGEIAHYMYFIRKGCLRLWFNKAGKDITFQFFIEGQGVSSLESFLRRTRSAFSIESIEPTSVVMIARDDWDRLFELVPRLKDDLLELIMSRMENYAQLFLSRIRDNPRERYEALVRERRDIIQRIPQRYIASYLGITPVSLSRIRGRISRRS